MSTKKITIAVAGNPNCGKTTLFNGLTGGKQRIGNWPGVTVEKKEGILKYADVEANIVDLPGIYSLSVQSEDEKVARNYILSGEPDLVVNIIDAMNLERNLYLTTQLLEMKVPVLLILNRMDLVRKRNIEIDIALFAEEIGCPVIDISAIKKQDLERVKQMIVATAEKRQIPKSTVAYPDEIEAVVKKWSEKLQPIAEEVGADRRWVSIKVLEGETWVTNKVLESGVLSLEDINAARLKIESLHNQSTDIVIADYRYGFIHGLTRQSLKRKAGRQEVTDKIDRFVLHRFFGLPFFLVAMYVVFWVTMNIGGAFIDFFDIFFGTIFVDGFGALLHTIHAPEWLIAILAGGIGAGVQTVATFVPIIFFMFLMLSLLEDSGYMARAAFVMDKFMRYIGLPGKSFVAMLVGFGCTVPAVLATRTLENRRDRLLTIFVTPFMSCGARLPVYVLFAAAFFPHHSGNIVFSLYLAGIIIAVITGLVLKKTLFKGEPSHFVMELPTYNLPRFKHIMFHTWNSLKEFILRAGKVIVVIVMLLSTLNSLGVDGSFGNENSEKSVLSHIGKGITPLFKPIGIKDKNWPASVAIFTGLFAKEAVVGTLSSLYSQMHVEEESPEDSFDFWGGLAEAWATIPEKLAGAMHTVLDPLGFSILAEEDAAVISEEIGVNEKIFPLLRSNFSEGGFQAYAYLLFILLYLPCVAAVGAIVREAGFSLGTILSFYVTIMGWIVATLFYQFTAGHQLIWMIVPSILFLCIVYGFHLLGKSEQFDFEENEDL